MQNPDAVRLRHMLEAVREALEYARPLSRRDLPRNRMAVRAIVGVLTVLGEAASKVGDATRARAPEVPWSEIVGMRNRLIHGYHDINLDIVWATVSHDLPPLVGVLEKVLADLERR